MRWETRSQPHTSLSQVEYVYPNISSLRQRGSLSERWRLAIKEGCDFVEMPADFVKNKSEVERTGLALGEMLGKKEIQLLYEKDENLPSGLEYVLHTDPGIPRRGEGGFFLPALDWENPQWVMKLARMVVDIETFLGRPMAAIEIHSGGKKNSLESLIASMRLIHDEHFRSTGQECQVLVENKVGQAVADAEDMSMLWRMLEDSGMQDFCGIMLDIPNLYKAVGKRFSPNLDEVPNDSIRGMHIHWKHGAPNLSDPIDWTVVFEKVRSIEHQIKINPEVFHASQIGETINFCEHILGRWQRIQSE